MEDLKGRSALVTGASTGIGAAVAIAYAARGMRVAVHYNSSARGGGTRWSPTIQAAGGEAFALQADVRDSAAIRRVVGEARDRLGAHRRAGQQRRQPGQAAADRRLRRRRVRRGAAHQRALGAGLLPRGGAADARRRGAAAASSTCRRSRRATAAARAPISMPAPRASSAPRRAAWRRNWRPTGSASTPCRRA